jgi:hypothetical protein
MRRQSLISVQPPPRTNQPIRTAVSSGTLYRQSSLRTTKSIQTAVSSGGLGLNTATPQQPSQEYMDPLLKTQLNQMNRLSRKLTSRDLMEAHIEMKRTLEPKSDPLPAPIPKSKTRILIETQQSHSSALPRSKSM